jgi:hypothetical protein
VLFANIGAETKKKEQVMNNKNEQNNRGQYDGSHGRYNPPHEKITDVVRVMIAGQDRGEQACREAYDKGHKNGSR